MPTTYHATIKNTSKARQGIWTVDGLKFIDPKKSRTVTMSEAGYVQSRRLPYLAFSDVTKHAAEDIAPSPPAPRKAATADAGIALLAQTPPAPKAPDDNAGGAGDDEGGGAGGDDDAGGGGSDDEAEDIRTDEELRQFIKSKGRPLPHPRTSRAKLIAQAKELETPEETV